MALRLTRSSTQYCKLESGLWDINAAYTITGWLRVTTANGAGVFAVGSGSLTTYEDSDALVLASPLRCYSYKSGSGSNTDSTSYEAGSDWEGVWQHVALVRTSSTDLAVYRNGVKNTASNTTDVTSRTAPGWFLLGFGYFEDALDGRLKDVKVWTRALSAAELLNESKQSRPMSATSLYAWYPLAPGSRTKDFSGNGHDLTEINSPTDEADPPVPWGAPLVSVPAIAAAAAGAIEGSTTGAATTSGTITGGGSVSGTVTGAATTAGAITGGGSVSGTVTGAATTSGTVSGGGAVTASVTGAATTSATITGDGALTGTVTGTATTSGTIGAGAITGTVTGTATTSGTITGDGPLTGTVTGTATVSGTPDLGLVGSVTGLATAAGTLIAAAAMVGTVTGTATVSGTMYGETVAVVTTGSWSSPVTILAGSEWRVVISGDAADAPRVRMVLRFLDCNS